MTANPLSTIPPIGPTTGMTPPPGGSRLKPIDPVKLLRQHAFTLVITGLVGLILGTGLWFTKLKLAPRFSSTAVLHASGMLSDVNAITLAGNDARQLDEVEAFIRNQVEVILSQDILRRTVDRPLVRNTEWFQQFNGDVSAAATALFEDHLSVNGVRGSTLIKLSIEMREGQEAQQVLNQLIDVYLNNRRTGTREGTVELTRVHDAERQQADIRLNSLLEEARRFLSENEISTLQQGRSSADIEYQNIVTQRVALMMELEAARGQAAMYLGEDPEAEPLDPNRPMSEMEEAYIRMIPAVSMREEQIRQLNEEIRTQRSLGRGEGHPYMKQVLERLSAVEEELSQQQATELEKYRAAQAMIALQAAESLQGQVAELMADEEELRLKMMEMTQKIERYHQYQAQIDGARLAKENAELAMVDVRKAQNRPDAARVSRHIDPEEAELSSPMWFIWIPATMMICLGSVGGLIFMREILDQRVKSPADVKLLPEATLLGVLPHGDEDPSGNSVVERIVEKSPTGLMAESFRQVRTAVLSKMDRRGYKTLVVVSAQPEAGTSSVAQNLATSLAYNGRNVLILDANFRRPGQHKLAEISNGRGLVDILRSDTDAAEVIHQLPNRTLSVLPTGQASEAPPELLEGPAFRALLGRLEAEYDLVIIDAPPALLTSDSQLLAKHVDAIAVVVKAGDDKRGMVERMLGKLDGQRADVLGVILNGVKTSAGGYFRKSYEDFYRYSHGDRDGKARGKSNGTSRAASPEPAEATETL